MEHLRKRGLCPERTERALRMTGVAFSATARRPTLARAGSSAGPHHECGACAVGEPAWAAARDAPCASVSVRGALADRRCRAHPTPTPPPPPPPPPPPSPPHHQPPPTYPQSVAARKSVSHTDGRA